MRKQRLILGETSYLLSDIQSGKFEQTKSYETQTLNFCRDWLTGKDFFTLQTSGTTGTPKKIAATRNQLRASAQLTTDYLGLKRDFNALICLDTNYIAGIMMLVRSLETGMDMYVIEPTANPFDTLSEKIKIDFAALVPYQVQAILKTDKKFRFNEGIFLIGGAPLSKQIFSALQTFSGTFYVTYGMTETLSHIALQRLSGSNPQNYFQVLPGISTRMDERGCLVIDAPHLNSTSIITNDLVELIDQSKFRWLGRADNIINSGGIKISPEKIERAIEEIFNELKLENQFFVAGLPHPELDNAVSLIIEGQLSTHQQESIAERLQKKLSRYEIPKAIYYAPVFIKTDTGKVNKTKTLENLER